MTASSNLPAPNLMPLMRYRDLAEAMGWLEQAFGFEKQIAVSDNEGAVIYGQMTYRGSLMMMGAVRDTDLDKLMRQPDEVGGVETQSCYIVVDDADVHYAQAMDAGAEVVLELKSDGLGRRGYSCRDPEGHIWNFGTYNPGKGLSMTVAAASVPPAEPAPEPRGRSPRLLMSLAALIVALGATCWWFADGLRADLSMRLAQATGHSYEDTERAYAELVKVRAEKRKSDEMVRSLSSQMEAEKSRRIRVEAEAKKATDSIGEVENARRVAEDAVASLRAELKREREALEAAIEARRVSEEKLAVRRSSQEEVKQQPAAAPQATAQQAPPPSAPQSAAVPGGVSEIETSATSPSTPITSQGKTAQHDDGDDDDDSARDRASGKRAVKSWRKTAKPAGERPQRILPTYVMGLHDVPWPYTTWYK